MCEEGGGSHNRHGAEAALPGIFLFLFFFFFLRGGGDVRVLRITNGQIKQCGRFCLHANMCMCAVGTCGESAELNAVSRIHVTDT